MVIFFYNLLFCIYVYIHNKEKIHLLTKYFFNFNNYYLGTKIKKII